MSMIRDLRAVVRPALRKSPASYDYGPTRDAVTGTSAVVDCAVYRDGVRCTDSVGVRDALETVRAGRASEQCDGSDGFVWIGLHEPTEQEFAGIAQEFGLHPLAVEDAVHAHQRPKLETYDDMVFAVVKTVHYDDRLPGGTAEVVETGYRLGSTTVRVAKVVVSVPA